MHLAILMLAALGAEPTVFELSAERIVHDGAHHRAFAEGNAALVTSSAALDADRITWDHDSDSATAIGHVALRITKGDLLVIVADVLTVRFDDDEVREIYVNDGKVLRKKGVSPQALRAIKDQDQLVHTGETTLLLTGNHLVREDGLWKLDTLDMVPCECNFDKPSWSIRAHDATIDTESQRASLWGPTVRVHGVPVLWLPWLSLPLSDRQTGLLVPKPSFTGLNGFGIEQPIFLTLGRSADLTLTPGYFGGSNGNFGVAGPRLLTEFRYAPSPSITGRITLGLLYDLRAPRSAAAEGCTADTPSPSCIPTGTIPKMRGLRGEASLQHVQELSSGWHDRIDAAFLSDGYYQRDLVADVLAREAGYLRSTFDLFHRGPDHWLGIDVAIRQDLRWGYPVFGRAPGFQDVPVRGPNPLHRLPAITWSIPERPLLGPINFSLFADYVRLAPTQGLSGDEGMAANEGRALVGTTPITPECSQQRLYWAGQLDPLCVEGATNPTDPLGPKRGMGDRQWEFGEREARDRFQIMPRVSATLPLLIVTVTPYAAWRQGVWVGEVSGRAPTQRGYPLLGARVDSEIYRFFGDLRHAIAPAIEVRGVPFVVGTAPAPYDEVDTAIPSQQPQLQAIAELRQRVTRNGAEVARLDVGQGIQLAGAAPGPFLGESYARLGGGFGWVSGALAGRYDSVHGQTTRLSASLSINDGKGHGGYAGYENLIAEGTDRSRRPIDLLFGLPAPNLAIGRAQSLTFGASWRLGGFGLRYDALMLSQNAAGEGLPSLAQHSLGVSYAPACDCFRLEVSATQRPGEIASGKLVPDFGATLTISRFGSFGISR